MKKYAAALLTGTVFLLSAMPEKGPDHECTSWMVFSDLTGNGTAVLHKNRDAKARNVTAMKSGPASPRKWIGLGNNDRLCMGMNAAGLAACMNSGEPCIDPPPAKGKMTTSVILQYLLEQCDTASQAAKLLQDLHSQGNYAHWDRQGSIYFFTDPVDGYICELSGKFCSVQRYSSGYAFRANIWHNPGMAQRARSSHARFLNNCGRESVVLEALNTAIDKKHRIALSDILALSRQDQLPKDSPLKRSVCSQYTNSASTLVIHREYPDVLSTAYVLIGPPRHTLYLPIPICVEKFDRRQSETVWSDAAWNRFAALGLHAPIPAEWSVFEKESIARYEAASAEALSLLRNGKKNQAVRMLNQTASEIWGKALEILHRTMKEPGTSVTIKK